MTRIANILDCFKKNTHLKPFIKAQFNYCPFLWMFRSRSSNNLISKIHEIALNLTSEINDISFNKLFFIDVEVSIQNKTIKALLTEVYKNLDVTKLIMLNLLTALRDKSII